MLIEVCKDLDSPAIALVLAKLDNIAQHPLLSLLLLPASVAFINHASELGRVAISIVQIASRSFAIATSPSGLLVVAFKTLGDCMMDDKANIWFVNAHTKCNCCHDDVDFT